jgi:hypothetical protein
MRIRILVLAFTFILSVSAQGQTTCKYFTEYRSAIMDWAMSTIDSLKKQGIDTILFYGVGFPETGFVGYGKIIWVKKGNIKNLAIRYESLFKPAQLAAPVYDSIASYDPIRYYSDYRLDTVKTLPKELTWKSHDFVHYVYSTIQGVEVCFIAEEYLLQDYVHFRSQWIRKLSGNVPPYVLCRVNEKP